MENIQVKDGVRTRIFWVIVVIGFVVIFGDAISRKLESMGDKAEAYIEQHEKNQKPDAWQELEDWKKEAFKNSK